jgi:catechol 2,3-dioxygenase-like lactoylglutathione lyase family enzyme
MFDHVTIRVSDVEASRLFYETALATLGVGEPYVGGRFLEWNDFSISQASEDKPVTRNLHLALVASSREAVDEWWSVMTGVGYEDDGPPGLRPIYRDDYYGAFVLDPDGNSVEAVSIGSLREGDEVIDHLWIRASDLAATKRFYEAIAPFVSIRIAGERPREVSHCDRESVRSIRPRRPTADGERPSRVSGSRQRDGRRVPPRRARRRLPRQRSAGRAARLSRGLLRRLRARSRRQQRRGRLSQQGLRFGPCRTTR